MQSPDRFGDAEYEPAERFGDADTNRRSGSATLSTNRRSGSAMLSTNRRSGSATLIVATLGPGGLAMTSVHSDARETAPVSNFDDSMK